MTATGCFHWHQRAAAFVGGVPLARPAQQPAADRLHAIDAQDDLAAMTALGALLGDGTAFCVAEGALASDLQAQRGDFLTLSGGSTGAPKAIRRSQASWIASFQINAARFGLNAEDSTAVLGRLTHSLSLYAVLEGLHLGLDVHLLAGLAAAKQRAALRDAGVSILYATPTQLRVLAQGAGLRPLAAMRLVLCGGGHLDAATRTATQALCPNAVLHEFYGSAETSFITLADSATPSGSVGRAYPLVEIEIRDSAGNLSRDTGEVWVRSPYLFKGYALGSSLDTRWDGDALSVGEIGRLDDTGFLWLTGRRSRMVTISDQNVFPEAIEATIAAFPDVTDCAVLPVPDRLRGHRLVAVIAGAADPLRDAAILDACRRRHGALISPQRLRHVDPFPVLPSGKPDLAALARWLEASE
ncbi:long-chain acyl-CoA synthetase [Sulfitobacter brevis]|uniref:Long-chain acyl-CoA synthetase n=1 Tax=Sulfitobacter brevis TaxID=74348 RepID=A0A1I2D803_9RHOB|nr:AMP-binding protein [Sulfitobacter brevis]SFE76634.1 long-chain acyl-CoA synthetase [Sulfitobacter brevis]